MTKTINSDDIVFTDTAAKDESNAVKTLKDIIANFVDKGQKQAQGPMNPPSTKNIPTMSLITDDDRLCQLFANISSTHPIDYKILTNREDITYKEVCSHLLRQERPIANAPTIAPDMV